MPKRYVLINKTDGVLATPTYFETEADAWKAANEFRLRFCLIGSYYTARGQTISPGEIEFEVHQTGDGGL